VDLISILGEENHKPTLDKSGSQFQKCSLIGRTQDRMAILATVWPHVVKCSVIKILGEDDFTSLF